MVCCGVLLGLVLLSLLSSASTAEIKNLAKIIKKLQDNYEDKVQFAMAINVPAQQCSDDGKPDQNFLSEDDLKKAKKDMDGSPKVYKGQELIGARPKPIPGSKFNYHSEYLLLIRSNPPNTSADDPLMKRLLERGPNRCVIFYTFNSPCVNTCSTPNKPYSIIPALDMFKNYHGQKAFVFSQVWKNDEEADQWEKNMKVINEQVPLFRCDNGCTRCVDNNNVVNDRCKKNKHRG